LPTVSRRNDGLDRRHRHHHHHHHVVVSPTTASNERVVKAATVTSPLDWSNDENLRSPVTQCNRLSSAHSSELRHVICTEGNRRTARREGRDRVQPMSGQRASHASRRTASATANPSNAHLSRCSRLTAACKISRRALSAREIVDNASTSASRPPAIGSRSSSSCGSSCDSFVDADPEVASSVATCRTVRVFSPWKEDDPERVRLFERRAMNGLVSDGSTAFARDVGGIRGTRRRSSLSARRRTMMTSS